MTNKFIIENNTRTIDDLTIISCLRDIIDNGETEGLKHNRYKYVNSFKLDTNIIISIIVQPKPYGYRIIVNER